MREMRRYPNSLPFVTMVSLLISLPAWGAMKDKLTKAPILASPLDIVGKSGQNAPYWVCADSASSKLELRCDDLGSDGHEESNAELMIKLETSTSRHEYGLRH